MNEESLRVPTPPQQPNTIHVTCDCKKEKFSWFNFFGKVFLSISAFVLASFMPFIILFALLVFLIIGVAASSDAETSAVDTDLQTEYVFGKRTSSSSLLEIPIQGIILGERSDGADFSSLLYGGITYGADVREYLAKAAKDNSIKGVVLLINSPGGTVHGSEMLGEAVKEFRESSKKPVYAHITGLGASGAYWSAVSAEKIYADGGSLTGSIGVILGSILYYDEPVGIGDSFSGSVDTAGGIEEYGLSAGKGKDFGNPFRRPTDEELSVYRGSLDREYQRFLNVVSEGRGIPDDTIRNQIGAFVYDNSKALEYKLIDGTQYREKTYAQLAEKTGVVGNDYKVVRIGNMGLFAQLFAKSKIFLPQSSNETSKALRSSSLCIPKNILVYHGDIMSLCK